MQLIQYRILTGRQQRIFFFPSMKRKKKGFELEEKKRAFEKSGRYVRPFRLINPLIRSAHVLYVSPSSVTMIASFTYKSLDSLCWRFKYYIFFYVRLKGECLSVQLLIFVAGSFDFSSPRLFLLLVYFWSGVMSLFC